MKILLTSAHLENFSGSKQWVYTIAKEFAKSHDVTVTSPRNGVMAKKIQERGIRVEDMATLIESGEKFDLGIISQVQTAPVVKAGICDKTVYVSHGLGNADKPLLGCDVVCAMSDEVKDKWGIKNLIYNPVDTEWFYYPKKVLYLSEHGGLKGVLKQACDELGYELRHAKKTWDVKGAICWADVVVGVGRGCLEAMSCGKSVIVADYRKYNGKPLMDYTYNVSHNCSGRCDKVEPTVERLKEHLLGNRLTMLLYHSSEKVCKRLLQLADTEQA
jgi:hypothetical protein